ncbi:MAG: hypothetical protein OMM_05190 [Candidatus Magnetoglobus multicellularis str. Araruama]|uniref:CobB/CobQ-like glutamine amidotransferase domain-containing protein n=1 Tax=Candidatus Magnetoglobus multicellularis str. Araruama TaxID=890399 RepID=A0A1V1NXM1_9BACT|nr:MAG: hypothetical protein OMM_05190 [Candidatus Magnetoglobus multicellularis str. Araruama]
MLKDNGANLVYFSPIKDKELPEDLSGIYFGGGYPELFAQQLSENRQMCNAVKEASANGMPIYGECGGFMYLCRNLLGNNLSGENNIKYPMTDCFPFSIKLLKRLKSLGYREISLLDDSIIGPKGMKGRGHEFHYSEIANPEIAEQNKTIEKIYSISDRKENNLFKEGFRVNKTLGSYVHLHFGSLSLLNKKGNNNETP